MKNPDQSSTRKTENLIDQPEFERCFEAAARFQALKMGTDWIHTYQMQVQQKEQNPPQEAATARNASR